MKKVRQATRACAFCGNVGKPRQLNELLQHDKNEQIVVLCDQCIRALKYADAHTWKWFRDFRHQMKKLKKNGPAPCE